jgi:hypothetical protein
MRSKARQVLLGPLTAALAIVAAVPASANCYELIGCSNKDIYTRALKPTRAARPCSNKAWREAA